MTAAPAGDIAFAAWGEASCRADVSPAGLVSIEIGRRSILHYVLNLPAPVIDADWHEP